MERFLVQVETVTGTSRNADETPAEYARRVADRRDLDDGVTDRTVTQLETGGSGDGVGEGIYEAFLAEVSGSDSVDTSGASDVGSTPSIEVGDRASDATPDGDGWGSNGGDDGTRSVPRGSLRPGTLAAARRRGFRSLPSSVPGTRRDYVYLAAIIAVALYRIYRPLDNRSLRAWDEGIYGNAAKHVVTEGYWLIPRTTGFFMYGPGYQPFLEKPPLVFWLQGLSMKVFGVTEFAVRFQSATFAVLTAVVAYVVGKDIADRRAGFLAGVVFLSTPAVFRGTSSATQGGTDMAVIFFGSLMTYLVWRGVRADDSRWLMYASLPAVGAVMSKGFDAGAWVFVVVPLLLLRPWLVVSRDMAKAVGITLALCVPWPLYAWHRYGHEFVEIIFFEQVWKRIAGETMGARPFYDATPLFEFMQYPYLQEYPLDFDPWSYLLVPAVVYLAVSAWRREEWCRRADVAFVVWWFACIFGFYLRVGNLLGYVLKTFVPAAVLVGWLLAEASRGRRYARVAVACGGIGMLALSPRTRELSPVAYPVEGAALGIPGGVPGDPLIGTEFVALAVVSLVVVVVYAELSGLARTVIDRILPADGDDRRVSPAHLRLAGTALAAAFVVVAVALLGAPGLDSHTSEHEKLGEVIDEETPENTPVYMSGGAERAFSNYASVGFYANRELRGGYYRPWQLARGDHHRPTDVRYVVATRSEIEDEENQLEAAVDLSRYEPEVLHRFDSRYGGGGEEMVFVEFVPRTG